MAGIVRIDDEVITTDDFIRTLKLSGQFEGLVEQMVRDRLTARAARQAGLQLQAEQIQERADAFRRALGLHRATDTNHYLDALGVSLDEFEAWIVDGLYQEKMMEQVCSEQAVAQYFSLNSPRFDSVEVSHIVLDSEGAAREMMSVLQEEPEAFAEMAREHSIDDGTRQQGGVIGKVLRGSLKGDIERACSMRGKANCWVPSPRPTAPATRSAASTPGTRRPSMPTLLPRCAACCARNG